MLSLLFSAALQDVQPELNWTLEHAALPISQVIQGIIKENLKQVGPKVCLSPSFYRDTALTLCRLQNPLSALTSFVTTAVWPTDAEKPRHAFLAELKKGGRPVDAIVGQILGITVGTMIFAQGVAQVVDFYMDDARAKERAEIIKLVHGDENNAEQKALLLGYVREAQRKSFFCLWRGVC